MDITFQSEIDPVKRILLKHAREAFISQEFINGQWQSLRYLDRPDFETAVLEYDEWVKILKRLDIRPVFLEQNDALSIDSIYCRDASILTDAGAILCHMGKDTRKGEPRDLALSYEELGIPILGSVFGEGRIEGGDTFWIDRYTLAVGRGYRTNAEGIRQLRILAKEHFEVVEVPLPHFKGPHDVFHLMSMVSPVDHDLFLVYSPLLPVPFRELLLKKGIELLEVPEQEFDSHGCNVLTLAPRQCILLQGNPLTQQRLVEAGVEVHSYKGIEISIKGAGGPTCLSRPLERSIRTEA